MSVSAVSLGRVGNLNSKPMRRQWIQSKWIYEVSAELSFGSPLKMAKTNLIFPTANANTLKYISLLTLTLQNAILGLSMRYARTRPGEIFLSSTGAQRCIVGIHPIYPHHLINICNLRGKLSKCLPNYIGCTRSSCSIRIYKAKSRPHTHSTLISNICKHVVCFPCGCMYICAGVWVREWFCDFDWCIVKRNYVLDKTHISQNENI